MARGVPAAITLGLTLGAGDARPALALGLLLGPVLVLGFWDVTERAIDALTPFAD